ncbi:60Kd inner membrane protein-domain-containing protein [Phlebopus sp. FC_14]|nr:60Kd inner membrane protein-domain-containing protein [Phlebopus sp. FC_14]
MLARHACRRTCISGRVHKRFQLETSSPLKRTFVSVGTLSESFLDVASALQVPPSWPSYSTAIILSTVISRLIWTAPFSVWAKRRQWRAEEEVMPIVHSLGPAMSKRVLAEMRNEGVRGPKEKLQAIHSSRVKKILTDKRKELFAQYGCRPFVTMMIPPLTQLPLFVGFSVVLARLSQNPTPFDSESFLTLSTLTHVDSTGAFPIALGFITLANVESSRWFLTDAQRQRQEKVQKWKEERVARGETIIEPEKIIKSALRLISIGRIIVASMVPGGVVLYWVTSATFGLIQTWILDYWELRRKRRLATLTSHSKKDT